MPKEWLWPYVVVIVVGIYWQHLAYHDSRLGAVNVPASGWVVHQVQVSPSVGSEVCSAVGYPLVGL